MLLDQRAPVLAALEVEIEVDLAQHQAAVGLVVIRTVQVAHDAYASCGSEAVRVMPRSVAYCSSVLRRLRRPRCSRDMTVPIGVPMMSAISLYEKPSTSAR